MAGQNEQRTNMSADMSDNGHANHDVTVNPLLTPNPSSVRFSVNRTLLQGRGRDFPDRDEADGSPLPQRLFAHPEISAVYIGRDFVTVSVEPGNNPLALADFVVDAIKAHIASGEPPVGPAPNDEYDDDDDEHEDADGDDDADNADGAEDGDDEPRNEIERKIIDVLAKKVRPAVAMDGGDVQFAGFDQGIVLLKMRGACAGCPSATYTLKIGIENLLKEEVPEVIAVESI